MFGGQTDKGCEGASASSCPSTSSATTTDLDVEALGPERDTLIGSVTTSLVCVKCDGD